jgi:hypothetical protein
MTWKEFKERVEEAGIKDNDKLFYIDTGNYPDIEDLGINTNKDEGFSVVG